MNTKKCQFAAGKVKVFGHIVSDAGVSPDPDKIRAVIEFLQLVLVKHLQSFCSFCSNFRHFVREFTSTAALFCRALKRNSSFG